MNNLNYSDMLQIVLNNQVSNSSLLELKIIAQNKYNFETKCAKKRTGYKRNTFIVDTKNNLLYKISETEYMDTFNENPGRIIYKCKFIG